MMVDVNCLPDEIIIHIFTLLPLDTLVTCDEVCQRWRKLARDPAVWRRMVVMYSGKPGHKEISARNLQIIGTHSRYITCLRIQYEYNYPLIKSILDKCKNLLWLEVVMCRIGKDFEGDLKRWPKLKKLNLKNTLLLQSKDRLFIQYDLYENMRYLSLSNFGLSIWNCDRLLQCRHLTDIFIEKIWNLPLEFVSELIVARKEILRSLHIHGGAAVNDDCLQLLTECPRLKDLAIIRCERLTDAGLPHLTKLYQIRHLQLWNNVTFSEIGLLRTLGSPNLIKLTSLSLSRIRNMSPVIVDLISEYYKELKFLAVYQCPKIINTDYEHQLKSKFRNIDVVLY